MKPKQLLEHALWIAFAILWVVFWFWVFYSGEYVYSETEDTDDPYWYQHIGEPDTNNITDSYYIQVIDDTGIYIDDKDNN